MQKTINKNIMLLDGTKISIDISLPVSDIYDVGEERYYFVSDIMINQVLRGLRKSIDAYKSSELPDKYLNFQEYIVTNNIPYGILGAFRLVGDDIIVEADAISGIRPTSAAFLLGHEMGHKIDKYIDTKETYASIASSFGIGSDNEEFLREMYANICGLIASNNNDEGLAHLGGMSLPDVLSEGHTEYLKRQVLKGIYHS